MMPKKRPALLERLLRRKGRGKDCDSGVSSVMSSASSSKSSLQMDSETKLVDPCLDREQSSGASDNLQPHSSEGWINSIPLKPLQEALHPDPGVAEAQERLKEATEKLGAVLKNYGTESAPFWALTDKAMNSVLLENHADGSTYHTAMQVFIRGILDSQETQKDSISGKIASLVVKLIPMANLALGTVSIGADAGGLLPLKFAANGLTQLLTLAKDHQYRSEIVVKQLEKIGDCQIRLEIVRSAKLDNSNPAKIQIIRHTTNLLTSINNFLRISLVYLNTNILKKFGQALINDDDLLKSKAEFDQALSDFDDSLNLAASGTTLKHEQQIAQEETLNFLSDMNFKVVQDDIRKERMSDTGQWLLETDEFKEWWKGETPLLWCSGLAGSGKTVLTSLVVDHICPEFNQNSGEQSENIGIAYIYCNYSRQKEQTALNLIKSIVRQLVERDLSLDNGSSLSYAQAFEKEHDIITPTLEDYLKLISSITKRFKKTIIVIDALDECAVHLRSRPNRSLFIDSLRLLPELKLLITSRNLPEIKKSLKGAATLRIQPHKSDILFYIESRIKDKGPLHYCITSELKSDIKKTIEDKYSEIFILVRLVLDYIWTMDTVGDVREALATLPTTTDGFYGLSIQRILNGDKPDRVLKLLAWLLHSKKPLKVQELRHALAVQPKNTSIARHNEYLIHEEVLVNCCAGLVLITGKSKTIEFSHPTVKEYLETEKVHKELFSFNPDVEISRTCLAYLSYDVFDNGQLFGDDISFHDYPLLRYAASNWGKHARGKHEREVAEMASDYLSQESKLVFYSDLMKRIKTRKVSSKGSHGLFGWLSGGRTSRGKKQRRPATPPTPSPPPTPPAPTLFAPPVLLPPPTMATATKNIGPPPPPPMRRGPPPPPPPAFWRGSPPPPAGPMLILPSLGVPRHPAAWTESTSPRYWKTRVSGICVAIYFGLVEVSKNLLNRDPDILSRTNHGKYPLQLAVEYSTESMVKMLVDNFADLEQRDEEGRTAMHIAVERGSEEILNILLDKGADIEAGWIEDDSSTLKTPLFVAASKRHKRLVRLLLKRGASVAGDPGAKAVSFANSIGDDILLSDLTNAGASVTHKDHWGNNILHEAIFQSLAVIKLLITKGAEVDGKNHDGKTALHLAVEYELQEAMEALLDAGADVEATDKRGETALHYAVEGDYKFGVERLLSAGANVHAASTAGKTAMYIAVLEKSPDEIVELLSRAGAVPLNEEEMGLVTQKQMKLEAEDLAREAAQREAMAKKKGKRKVKENDACAAS